jgi:hypothetical protein
MARFDIRRLKTKGRINLVVEIQSDYMRDLPTVVVAPIVRVRDLKAYDLINPVIEVGGESMAIRMEQMAGVPATLLGDKIGSASGVEAKISVALQRLLFYV